MKKIYSILQTMSLFNHMDQEDLNYVLHCLKAQIKEYQKDEIICGLQEPVKKAGVVLLGEVRVSFLNKGGGEHSVRQFKAGNLFGEIYACIQEENSTLQIVALQQSKILFLCFSELFTSKALTCPYASQMTRNLLFEVAKMNVFLNKKVEILAQRKIRDRICIYLQTINRSDNIISIPLNRQELSTYLGVDRSALSRELGAMRDEGLLTFNRNKISILKPELLLPFSEYQNK